MDLKLFDYLEKYRFEQLVLCHDHDTGLRAVIAIHNTYLGPALGGTRMWDYKTEEDAILDALRLARGMTYKSAAAGLNLGGGKAVIMGDPRKDKSAELFRAFGKYVERLGGKYITAEDVGTSVQDMETISLETKHVTGVSAAFKSSGDPSPATAYGVWKGIQAAAKELFGDSSLTGKKIAIQGLGNVGSNLIQLLAEAGAELIITDIYRDKVKALVDKFGARAVDPEEIYGVDCDIFAPCALGAVVNEQTLPQFKCKIIAGSANNVLLEEKFGELLELRGILYVPDFVINAGGIINVADELEGYDRDRAFRKVAGIYENVQKVLDIAKRDKIPTYKAAEQMAEERLKTK